MHSYVYSVIPNELIGSDLGAEMHTSLRRDAESFAKLVDGFLLTGPPAIREAPKEWYRDCSELVWPMGSYISVEAIINAI